MATMVLLVARFMLLVFVFELVENASINAYQPS
jgi:hypothetical protein